MLYTITATLLTYDINQKYCHAMKGVVLTADHVKLTCEELKGYFEGKKMLKPKRFEAEKSVRMDYQTPTRHITITSPKAVWENREITFTGGVIVTIIGVTHV